MQVKKVKKIEDNDKTSNSLLLLPCVYGDVLSFVCNVVLSVVSSFTLVLTTGLTHGSVPTLLKIR